jgi:hypothetical protein
MAIQTSSLEEVGDVLLSAFGDYKLAITLDLFDNLMETTPEKTGTLKYNWRVVKGGSAGNFRQPNTGESWPDPPRPSEAMRIGKQWDSLTLYNNSEYIVKVNNGESGNELNQNFIQRALAMTNARF